ncbi:MAG: hypothetical protein ABSB69_16995 [Solirubrobacteraceae bacterium]
MNDSPAIETALPAGEERWRRLPPWLRPRTVELRGSGQMWLIETTLLVLVGVLLATATVNDLVREAGINHRLIADLKTWRQYTGHDYHNISVDQEMLGASSQREVLCGNTSPGAPKSRTQICLAIWGPVVNGMRTVHGGWYVRAHVENDLPPNRYGCFGPAGQGRCPE